MAEEAFGAWGAANGKGPGGPPVHITLLVRSTPDDATPFSPDLQHRVTGPHRILFEASTASALAEPDERRGRGVVDARWLGERAHFRRGLLEALTLAVLTPQDRQPLHAAAIVRDGTALLLSGRGGVGKSSLAYAAARAGFRLLSEDTVYLQLRPALRVWGAPGPLHLPPELGDAFPELASRSPVDLPSGKRKLRVEGVASAPPDAPDQVQVCLLRRNGARPGVERIPPEEVIRGLTSELEGGFDLFAETLREPVALLARRGGWRIDLPADPRDAVPWLGGMVEGTLSPP